MKVARAMLIAVLILLFAVTPLSALIAPGEFEVRFPSNRSSYPGFRPADFGFTVRLADRTGLVRGLAEAAPPDGIRDAITNYGVDGRMLIVDLEGSSCDYLTNLTFERGVNGFVIREMTKGFGCFMGTGMSHSVAIHLWAPVDASTVRFESLE